MFVGFNVVIVVVVGGGGGGGGVIVAVAVAVAILLCVFPPQHISEIASALDVPFLPLACNRR